MIGSSIKLPTILLNYVVIFEIYMKELIEQFLKDSSPAIVGISPKQGNWGTELLKNFLSKGYSPIPVGKSISTVEGLPVVGDVSDLPASTRNVIFAVSSKNAGAIIDQLPKGRFDSVWFVYGSKSTDVLSKAEAKGMKAIYGYCPLMFIDGTGIHKFHYMLKKIFS